LETFRVLLNNEGTPVGIFINEDVPGHEFLDLPVYQNLSDILEAREELNLDRSSEHNGQPGSQR
jgi:hypothetical protein